jgi:TonB family protein
MDILPASPSAAAPASRRRMAVRRQRWAWLLSGLLHALALAWLAGWTPRLPVLPTTAPETITYAVELPQPAEAPPPPEAPPEPPPVAASPPTAPERPPSTQAPLDTAPTATPAPPHKPRASRDAPNAPSAEDWAQASTYALKNGKRYRYNWGLQLRSLMGTAVEGQDNGVVRFRVTIAPDGSLAALETLWATSAATERLARQALQRMPPLPPPPKGQPLVFERTIAFDPWSDEMPPIYKDDCLPDPPPLRNPYVWDGQSPQGPAVQPVAEKIDAQAYAECLKQCQPKVEMSPDWPK